MARIHLLPQTATALERAVSETVDNIEPIGAGATTLRAFKYDALPDSVVPWLVVEYGLGALSPFLPNLRTVLEYGVRWSRLKGTPQGLAEAFSWSEYAFDTFYEAPTRRTRWHLFEVELDRLRDSETHLPTLEAVGRMSEPVRSEFWRVWHEYNVREVDWDETAVDNTMWDDPSGVRLHDGGILWSFGRTFEPSGGVHNMTEGELTALGAWIEPPDEEGSISWGPFPWTTPGLKWISDAAASRISIIATVVLAKTCWIGVYRVNGTPIGFRKARAFRAVVPSFTGYYEAGSSRYVASATGAQRLYVEAMTEFGEGDGETAHSWKVILGGSPPPGTPPGRMWLAGNAISGGTAVGNFTISAPALFGKTVRERFRGILKIV